MIGISWYFGFEIQPEQRAKLLKDYGIGCVITNADKSFDWQNGDIGNQIKIFKKYDLKHSSLHMRYKAEDLPKFWQQGKAGDKLVGTIIKDIKLAKKFGFTCVVVHLKGEYSSIGMQRLNKVLKVCEKYNVDIAVENLNNKELFLRVMDTVVHPNLKFCYDSGHHNVWMKDVDILEKYGNKLVALHLHSNMGDKDAHTLPRFGNVDWDYIAKRLAKLPQVNLDYELLCKHNTGLTAEQVLAECVEHAKLLQQKSNEYRNN